MNDEKSRSKSRRPGQFTGKNDPRNGNGRGPKAGAPNAGRPPSVVRQVAREAWADRIAKLVAIIDDPKTDPRVVVAAMAELRNGSGLNSTAVTGEDAEPLIPPQTWTFGDRRITF